MEQMGFAVSLIITGIFTYRLYCDSRSRDFGWVFWTVIPFFLMLMAAQLKLFIFLPIAVLIVLFYRMMRPKGSLFKCPRCGKTVHEELFVCPWCRRNAKHECLDCHEPVMWEDTQCPHCGSRDLTKE